jgi:VWFA-related protein
MQLPSNLFAQPAAGANAASFSEPGTATEAAEGDAPDDSIYADAMRAIHDSRWDDATSLFLRAARMHLGHAEGAYYWAAYTENKQGHSDRALATCAELRKTFPSSRWLEECGALEIEIRSASGDPVDPSTQQDEQLKLLALNSMMKKDESRALPQIQQILQGNQSESFKEKALFVLAQSPSPKARQMLSDVSKSSTDSALQAKARQMLATIQGGAENSTAKIRDRRTLLDVTVTDSKGRPVSGLKAADITVFDDGKAVPVIDFRSVGGEPSASEGSEKVAEVVIIIDTVNTSLGDAAYEREQVEKMLRADGGKLPYPTAVLMANGTGADKIGPTTQDGNAIADQLSQTVGNQHLFRRLNGFYSDAALAVASLKTLSSLVVEEGSHPGKKLFLWISPGWPLLAAGDSATTAGEERTDFSDIVALSTGMRQARIVLYCIDPPRTAGGNSRDWFLYEDYIKPVRKLSSARFGNLGLQVLAEQSGGLALNFSNLYLAEELQQIIADAGPGYMLVFNTQPAKQPNEYHDLKVTVDRPNLTVRTRAGYYSQP